MMNSCFQEFDWNLATVEEAMEYRCTCPTVVLVGNVGIYWGSIGIMEKKRATITL